MKNMKTLMLAVVTALTLGNGAAMAQEQGGPSFAPTTRSIPALPSVTGTVGSQANQDQSIQAGSSDAIRNEDLGMKAYDQYNPYAGGN